MTFEELLKDERMEAKAEAVLVLLQELGTVPDELAEKIMSEKNPTVLNEYLKYAAKAENVEDFAYKFE
ncbi:MAG: hypothetical protein K2H41_02880 [Acetatifactor sp.]|nr:hypothetical protein [Acetatifactor sp.]